MLTKTAKQLDGHPDFRSGLERHGELSQSQAERVKACLESLGESTSAVKNVTGQLTAFAQTLSGYFVGDEPVKAVLATSTFAQMEVTSYRILAAAAEAAQLDEVAGLCRTLLQEETGFADWLEQQAPIVTRDFLLVQRAEA
jgi:ferritin-like metal-binding protein YciE